MFHYNAGHKIDSKNYTNNGNDNNFDNNSNFDNKHL